ncbi:hypothetical protein STSP2_01419 [Anaerohalosphaera lusitana]|uniref:Uncharacterized protein n=1 Tax=Anaerohalosphaera lusitana TaxID=1936003 RepID=A0A1U9NJZ7_9BACT|nr:hypothetical protein [Anaerohalosphaera lusitana]AQT68263.1 hypothetical protein STSP2_01419 [Anaerohalosphaera lusitana]
MISKKHLFNAVAFVLLGVFLFFSIPFVFVGNILEEGKEDSDRREKEFLEWRFEQDPDLGEKYRKWKSGELELTTEEYLQMEEEIYGSYDDSNSSEKRQ